MTVDFEKAKSPAARVATISWTGAWSDKRIQREFEALAAWAKERRIRTGRWFFVARTFTSFQVGIEIRGAARGGGKIRVRKFPASSVVRVAFDPDQVSARVVYHGLADFLRYRRKDGSVKWVGDYREVYDANPWVNAKAWSRMRIEALVRP